MADTDQLIPSDRQELEQITNSLRDAGRKFRRLAETSPAAIFVRQGNRIVYANPAAEALTGYRRKELEGMDFEEIVSPYFRGLVRKRGVCEEFDAPARYQVKILTQEGKERWLEVRSAVVKFDGSLSIMEMAHDVTEYKRFEKQIEYAVLHDVLTGLPNRNFFRDMVKRALQRAEAHRNYLFAVVCLDLKELETLPEGLARGAIDQILLATARRLEDSLRPEDTVARLGHHSFGILLKGLRRPDDARSVVARIGPELTSRFYLRGKEIFFTPRIGTALSSKGYESAEDLLQDAESAARSSDAPDLA